MTLKHHARAHNQNNRHHKRGFQLYDSSTVPSAPNTAAAGRTGTNTPAVATTTAVAVTSAGAPPSAALLTPTAVTSAKPVAPLSSTSISYANVPPPSNDTTTKPLGTAAETWRPAASIFIPKTDTSSSVAIDTATSMQKASAPARSLSATNRSGSASSSASAGIANANSSSSTSLGAGSIAGIVAALCVFLLVIGCFFAIRSKARQKRKRAVEAYAPYSDWNNGRESTFELQDEASNSAGGMIERKPSWRDQGRPRDMGGPRPPTMIESGRAGMGAGGSFGRVSPASAPIPHSNMPPQLQVSDVPMSTFTPGQIVQPLYISGLAPLPPVAISSAYGETGPNDSARWNSQGAVGMSMGHPSGGVGYAPQQQQPSPQHQVYSNEQMYSHTQPLIHSLQPTPSAQQPYPDQHQQPYPVQSTTGQVQMQQPPTNRQTMFNPDDAYGGF